MTPMELENLIKQLHEVKAESQVLELKAAEKGCPTRLYDTLSSFSNQDDGGILLFGIDESKGFAEVGVYDAQDLMKHVTEQCKQMEPVVRPTFTILSKDGKQFVSAELPGMDVTDRPCFYRGKGRLTGSYIRVGDADEPMTEYEIYSYEAFRRKYQDDIRILDRASCQMIDEHLLRDYLAKLKSHHPNLARLEDTQIYELMSLSKDGKPTLAAVMLFGLYPQAYAPQLCITAVAVPGTELGQTGLEDERFLDNQRIGGTIQQMLEQALAFVRRNTRTKTIIDPDTGKRIDRTEYPMKAVREAILNALIHRDYSIHTEGMPIQLLLFEDRFEVRNPGGLYGRLRIDQLGKVQPDTRNPVLAVAMEELDETENRYTGIPTIRSELKQSNLPEPEFTEERGTFVVRFRRPAHLPEVTEPDTIDTSALQGDLLSFCLHPRSKQEIADFLHLSSLSYVMKRYIRPLVEQNKLAMTEPTSPRSPKQRYVSVCPSSQS